MSRLIGLSGAGAVVFAGFGIPFFVAGGIGLFIGAVTVAVGMILFRYTEAATRKSLQANTAWNRTMKGDGENLVERDQIDRKSR